MELFLSKMKTDPNAGYSFSVLYGLIEVAIRMENFGLKIPYDFKELMEVVKKLHNDAVQKYSQGMKSHNPDNMLELIRLVSLELVFIKPYKDSYKLIEEYRAKYIEIEQDVDGKYDRRRKEIKKIAQRKLAKKKGIIQQKRADREKKEAEEEKNEPILRSSNKRNWINMQKKNDARGMAVTF